MKKLLIIFCTTFLISAPALAETGLFIGVDGLHTNARHEADNSSLLLGPQDGDKTKSDDNGYGANIGVRVDPLFLFVSVEAFYERLNSSARGFDPIVVGSSPNIEIDDRYGAKANLGLTILPWFTPFITYGVARVNYKTDVEDDKTAPIYGVGLLFDLPFLNLSLKAAYDVQKFDIPYQNAESETKLGVAHLGLMYTF